MAALQIPIPVFHPLPVPTYADVDEPTVMEIIAFHNDIVRFMAAIAPLLAIANPQHGLTAAPQAAPPAGAALAVWVASANALELFSQHYFNVYATTYGQFVAVLAAQAVQPAAPPAAPPVPRPPKMKSPETFTGKTTTEAWHFIRQCQNYLAVQNMPNAETEIRWALALMIGDAAQWRDEKLDELAPGAPAAPHMNDWPDFVAHFNERWTDPHKEEKQLNRIMQGKITQRTSVKIYNDLFNEALGMTTLTGADAAILRAYTTGLKPMVRNLAIAPLRADPRMTFRNRQVLMVDIDESLQQTRQQNPAPARQTMINNPVINLQGMASATPAPARATTPARGSTPIKVEAAQQYTKLTPEERAALQSSGSCFRCRQPGHMARNCPRGAARISAATISEEPAPASTEIAVTTPAPDSDFQ